MSHNCVTTQRVSKIESVMLSCLNNYRYDFNEISFNFCWVSRCTLLKCTIANKLLRDFSCLEMKQNAKQNMTAKIYAVAKF